MFALASTAKTKEDNVPEITWQTLITIQMLINVILENQPGSCFYLTSHPV